MGEKFDFKCPSCGYAEILSGHDDCGMTAATTGFLPEMRGKNKAHRADFFVGLIGDIE